MSWFIRNARETAWRSHERFGRRAVFDTREEPFPQLGFHVAVLEPGKPSGLYHAESVQEGFLVLEGECLAIVDGEERRLRQWDYFHCPAGTAHVLVGAEQPATVLMVGVRRPDRTIFYPRDPAAVARGAAAERETDSPREAYAPPVGHWQDGAEPGLQ